MDQRSLWYRACGRWVHGAAVSERARVGSMTWGVAAYEWCGYSWREPFASIQGLLRLRCVHAGVRAFKGEGRLASNPRAKGLRRPDMVGARSEILGQPANDVRAQPADISTVKATFAWDAAEQGETQHHPPRPACQACHIVRGEHLFPNRELLVDVRRETNAMRRGRRCRRNGRRLVGIHKRPSCVVPVV